MQPSPEQFKQMQRQSWGNFAQGWKTWWPTFEEAAQALSDRLVELAGVRPGSRVLDIATGIGEPAITAARRAQPNGKVLATDISPQMLAIAKERAEKLKLQNIEFKESDAESLNVPDQSFYAITCRWGLKFLTKLKTALKLLNKALKPGGKMAAAVWPAPEKAPGLDVSFGTVRKQLGLPPAPPDMPPFNLSDPVKLQNSFAQAGFRDVGTENFNVTYRFKSAEEFTNFNKAIAAPIVALLNGQPAERQKEIWQAVTYAARSYTDSSGRVRMDTQVICCVGTR
jgi:SAM-dependent methyltransferase